MHIGQFSLVICSFVLAVTAYFLLPDERSAQQIDAIVPHGRCDCHAF
jgi:hypothetical protein